MAILGVRGGTDGIPNMIFTTGETWSPNKTVQAYVYVIGAGGSGAGGGGNSNYGFSGGGAGGCAVSLLQLNAGVTYTAVIGAGGAYAGGASQSAGNAGGDSTFNSSDISIMTGSGGAAGAIASGASAASAAGGSASGGNLMNNTGGASLASGATRQVSGGGAVGLWDTGRQGTTVASANDWADGGNLSGPPIDDYPTDVRYGDDTFVAGAPFPEIYSVTSSSLRSRSDTVFDVNPSFQPAGVQPYSYLGEDLAYSGNTRVYPAPPFSGGNGLISGQDTYVYGGSASLGGGGGATLGTAGGSEGFSGKGGMGAVLIFPISMG
tara:strand:- start:618 stop:1580 length:963 start_codon:yes stop_codon:yes gene_type:complete